MYYIDSLPSMIEIGYTGEEKFRTVQIDMSAWMDLMPEGVPSIVHIRPGEGPGDAYIATTTFADNILSWEITANDMGAVEGAGIMQVWLEETENTTLVKRGKSATVATLIRGAINDPGDTEPPARTMLFNLQGEATTLPAGSSVTMEWEHDGYYGDYTLKLGIPKGDKGDPGDTPDISGKADKVTGATAGDLAGLDGNGNLTDSGHKPSEYAKNGEVAIMCEGDTHIAISSGEYVVVRNHDTLADGLYKATANIAQDGALSTSNLAAQGKGLGGAVNALDSSVSTLDSKVGSVVRSGKVSTNTTSGAASFTMENGTQAFVAIGGNAPITVGMTNGGTIYNSALPSGYTISQSGNTVTITKTSSVSTTTGIIYIVIQA